MKIELKSIHHSEQLSEETEAFKANVYINGVKAAIASNNGHGGDTFVLAINENGRQLMLEAESWCKSLPPEKVTIDEKEHSFPWTLSAYVDKLLSNHLQQKDLEKFRKKLARDATKGIVFGIPDQQYRVLSFKTPMSVILESPNGQEVLKNTIVKRVIPEMKEGDKILNINIPEKIFKDAGISEKDYVSLPQSQNKSVKKSKGNKL